MNTQNRSRLLTALVIIGVLALLAAILSFLIGNGALGSNRQVALTDYGALSPVESRGDVLFPVLASDGTQSSVPSRSALIANGTPYLLTPAGEAELPSNYLTKIRAAFPGQSCSADLFSLADACYLVVARTAEGDAVIAVIFRCNEEFFLNNYSCELTDALLVPLASALTGLGLV